MTHCWRCASCGARRETPDLPVLVRCGLCGEPMRRDYQAERVQVSAAATPTRSVAR